MNNALIPAVPVTLSDLAEQINTEHRQCEAALQSGLEHALKVGRLLIKAKKLCSHGTWLPWLEQNFEGKDRTARAYMQVVQRWPELEANRQRAANLGMSVREAMKLAFFERPVNKCETTRRCLEEIIRILSPYWNKTATRDDPSEEVNARIENLMKFSNKAFPKIDRIADQLQRLAEYIKVIELCEKRRIFSIRSGLIMSVNWGGF